MAAGLNRVKSSLKTNIIPVLHRMFSKLYRNKALTSLLITILIVGLLLIPQSATAISVSIVGLSAEIEKGTSEVFFIDILIESNERVPIDKLGIDIKGPTNIYREFPAAGGEQAPLTVSQYLSIVGGEWKLFGYGYGYGLLYSYGYGYGFGGIPGYGYGYGPTGYGYGYAGPQILRYRVVLDTSNMDVGDYAITAMVFSGSVKFISEKVSFEIVSPAAAPGVPTPTAPGVAPAVAVTAETINTNPEAAAELLTNLVETGRAEEAAMAIAEAESEAAARALVTIAETNPEVAAEILERVDPEKAAEILEAMVEELVETDRAADIVTNMDADDAARVIDLLVVRNPRAAVTLMEQVPANNRARILAEIVRLPRTPEKAAAILEDMTLEKAVESVEYMVKLGYISEAGLAISYLSAEKLTAIWAELSETTKDKIIPYMTVEALSTLSILFRAKTANLLIIPAGATELVSYAEQTGADLEITAKEYTAGIVKTAQYIVNPYKEASTPQSVTLKKFVYVEAVFPKETISSINLTIHYKNAEVKGLLEFTLTIYKYDSESNAWIPLPTTVNLEENTVTAAIEGTGTYALGGI